MMAKIKQSLFLIIAIGLAVFFVTLTLKQVDLKSIQETLKHANFFWIFLSMALSIVTYWIRASRWNLLLNTMNYTPKVSSSFWAISFAYFMNLTIPRSGEVARATTLYKMENIPFEKGFGSVVLERIIDLSCLLLLFGLCIIINYDMLLNFVELGNIEKANASAPKETSYITFYIAFSFLFSLAILMAIFRKKIQKLPLFNKIKTFVLGLWEGIRSISKLEKRAQFIGYSVALWVCYFLMTYIVFFAFQDTENLGISEGLFLLISGSLGMIIPVSGGLAYPYIMSIAFAAMYMAKGGDGVVGRSIGSYFGLTLYLAQISSMVFFGLLSIFFIARNKKKEIE